MTSSKIYPVSYNKDYYAVMSNDIIKGKQEMTLQEARIIRLLVTQVVKQDNDLKTYTVRIQELAEFLKIDSSNLYKDILKFCENLLEKKVRIGTGNPRQPWKIFQWISLAEYDGNGNITLKLSEEIRPYVIELNNWFTQYQLSNILSMQSFYAVRLYELLKMTDGIEKYKNEFEFTVQELREYFCCENKFDRISQFKGKVIETATNEITDKTDLRVIPTYKKTGRSITHISFEVHYQPRKQLDGQSTLFGGDSNE